MKRVLFVIGNAEIGGTRTSLFNLLNHLSMQTDVEVHLFMLSHYGSLIDRIPSNINILPESWVVNASLPKPNESLFHKIFHVGFVIVKKVIGYKCVFEKLFSRVSKSIEKKYGVYDAVFGYQEGICNYFASFINAKKHYTWIHNDIEAWFDDKEFEYKAYKEADTIIFVAETAKEKFYSKYPEFKNKCIVIKNTLNVDQIKNKAKGCKRLSSESDTMIFISVGRFASQKAFERIIPIANKLKSVGRHFSWYIVGDGPEKNKVEELIKIEGLTKEVVMLGASDNPYIYMKDANVLIVTSIYESQPMVILEALTLGIPVITTRYSSAEEILKDKPYGMICDNSIEGLVKTVSSLTFDQLEIMKKAAQQYEYDNNTIVKEIKGLF